MSKTPQFVANPGGLMDLAAKRLGTKSDAALARALDVAPPVISKLRSARMPVGNSMILKLHETVGISVKEIRTFIGGAP